MRRLLVLAGLMALVLLPACGGGDDGGGPGNLPGNVSVGPYAFAMPFLPTVEGEVLMLGLANLASVPAPITVTPFLSTGAPYPGGATTVVLPARGSARYPVTNFTGIGTTLGGWLEVETRDITDLNATTGIPTPIRTSGFVVPVMTRSIAARESDAAGGISFRALQAEVTINDLTVSAQLINASWLPMAGGALGSDTTFDIVVYDAFGDVAIVDSVTVPAYGSVRLDFGILQLGQIRVRPAVGVGQSAPAGTVFRFGIATLEDDPQVMIESRFLEARDLPTGQYAMGFDLDWGIDDDFNVHDFGVYMGNPTDSPVTIQLTSIRTGGAENLIPAPRLIALDAHATKYMASTTLDSRGLDTGEVSVFEDVFGNVDLATGLTTFSANFSIRDGVNLSARDFDSRFKAYYRILPGYRQTPDVVIPLMDYQTVATTGVRNYAVFTNPFDSEQQVNIRGFTPGGTEYLLDPVSLGAGGMVWWSPDGMVFREDPTDTTAPPVPTMTFLFSATGGIFYDGVRQRVDALGRILYRRPFVVRNLRSN